jgi:hypothetical protein
MSHLGPRTVAGMGPGRTSFPLRARLARLVGAVCLFGCFVYVIATTLGSDGIAGLLVCALAAAGGAIAAVTAVNLARHDGWLVVLADDAIELPATSMELRPRRDRVPYEVIEWVGLAPRPRMIVISVSREPTPRYVCQSDLGVGTVAEIARELTERVNAFQRVGRPGGVTYLA